jgi:hypothetical protein
MHKEEEEENASEKRPSMGQSPLPCHAKQQQKKKQEKRNYKEKLLSSANQPRQVKRKKS